MGDLIWLLVMAMFLLPFTGMPKIFTKHIQKMAEIKTKADQEHRDAVLKEIKAVRQELSEHKADVNEFQLGLDNRIDGLESRLTKIEVRATSKPYDAAIPGTTPGANRIKDVTPSDNIIQVKQG